MLSVNTNSGSMIALQYLNQTQAQLATVQNAINTGLKVSSAKDDGAVYAIAQNMRGNVAAYNAVTDSLNRGMSSVDVATSAGQSVSDLLIEMKQKALSASDKSLDAASRTALNTDFTSLRDQITTIVSNAVFNGTNLIDGSAKSIQALASADGTSTIKFTTKSMALGGSVVSVAAAGTIGNATAAATMLTTLDTSLKAVDALLAQMSSVSKKFSIQLTFTQKLSDTLTTGIGNLVDANMAQESALLTSLQTKQQLGVQALSIANQAPQTVLSLFR